MSLASTCADSSVCGAYGHDHNSHIDTSELPIVRGLSLGRWKKNHNTDELLEYSHLACAISRHLSPTSITWWQLLTMHRQVQHAGDILYILFVAG